MTDAPSAFVPPFSPPKRKLGRGLSSLFEGENQSDTLSPMAGTEETGELVYLDPGIIETGHYQPRLSFEEEALEELALSIREKGVLQPLLVRRYNGKIELVAGERRLRASKAAGLAQIPCRVLEITEDDAFEVALLENVQRSDLSPVEEAKGYRQLLDRCGYTQEALAQKIGKSRAHMSNILRLLTLPDEVQDLLDRGDLTPGHARALIGEPDAVVLAHMIKDKQLSVRETEALVRQKKDPSLAAPRTPRTPNAFVSDMSTEEGALAKHLSDLTGLSVKINVKPSGGWVQIAFKSPLELDAFLDNLTRAYVSPTPHQPPLTQTGFLHDPEEG